MNRPVDKYVLYDEFVTFQRLQVSTVHSERRPVVQQQRRLWHCTRSNFMVTRVRHNTNTIAVFGSNDNHASNNTYVRRILISDNFRRPPRRRSSRTVCRRVSHPVCVCVCCTGYAVTFDDNRRRPPRVRWITSAIAFVIFYVSSPTVTFVCFQVPDEYRVIFIR